MALQDPDTGAWDQSVNGTEPLSFPRDEGYLDDVVGFYPGTKPHEWHDAFDFAGALDPTTPTPTRLALLGQVHDVFRDQLRSASPEIARFMRRLKLRDTVGAFSSSVFDDASFIWLPLTSPLPGEAGRLEKVKTKKSSPWRKFTFLMSGDRGSAPALFMSCVAFGEARDPVDVTRPSSITRALRGSSYEQDRSYLHELLVRLLLYGAKIHSKQLYDAYDCDAFRGFEDLLGIKEAHMPGPHFWLPSAEKFSLAHHSPSGVPRYFKVSWPRQTPIIESQGLIGFVKDYYRFSVRRPHTRPPKFEFIRLLICPAGAPNSIRQPNVLLTCSSGTVLQTFFGFVAALRAQQSNRAWPLRRWSPMHQLLDVVSLVCQIAIQWTMVFLNDRLQLLQKMRLHGRIHPHRSKFQFLYHLDDQIARLRETLTKLLVDLDQWRDAAVMDCKLRHLPGAEWETRIDRLRGDVEHLLTYLDELEKMRRDLHGMLKEAMELNQGTRTMMLTILAGFYVPLAFVSSYFGMNTYQNTGPSGGLLDNNTFWEVSLPLVVATVIVPVAFSGLLARVLLKTVTLPFWRRYWPFYMFAIFLGLDLSYYYRSLPALFWTGWAGSAIFTAAALLRTISVFRPGVPNVFKELKFFRGTANAWEKGDDLGSILLQLFALGILNSYKISKLVAWALFAAMAVLFLVEDVIHRYEMPAFHPYHAFPLWVSLALVVFRVVVGALSWTLRRLVPQAVDRVLAHRVLKRRQSSVGSYDTDTSESEEMPPRRSSASTRSQPGYVRRGSHDSDERGSSRSEFYDRRSVRTHERRQRDHSDPS